MRLSSGAISRTILPDSPIDISTFVMLHREHHFTLPRWQLQCFDATIEAISIEIFALIKIMQVTYFENDDILQIRVSDKPIIREVSQDWHTNISYAEDGTIVEIVLLDARKEGLLPLEFRKAA